MRSINCPTRCSVLQGVPLVLALVACACGGIAKTVTTSSTSGGSNPTSPSNPSNPTTPGSTMVTVSPSNGECSGGWFGAVYGDGDGEFEYERDVERERDGGRVGYGGDDFCERELFGAGDFAESRFVDDHGDERGDDFGRRDECGDDFESDADACGRESGEHGDGKFFHHVDRDEFYFGRAGDAERHGADDDFCFFDAAHGERERIDFGNLFADGGESRPGKQQFEQSKFSDWQFAAADFGVQPDVAGTGREFEWICSLFVEQSVESGHFSGGGGFEFDRRSSISSAGASGCIRILGRGNIRARTSEFRTRLRGRGRRRFR